jgi:hypothetical protein
METTEKKKWDLETKSALIGVAGGLFLGFMFGMIYYQHVIIKFPK